MPSSAEFIELKEETRWLKKQVKAQALLIEQLIKGQAPQPASNLSPSAKDSYTFLLLLEGEVDIQCMADSPKHHSVATSRMFNLLGESMIHNVPLPADPVKVQLNTAIDPNYAHPADTQTVAQAVGSFVAWLGRLLMLGHPSKEYAVEAILEHGKDFMIPLEFKPEVYDQPSSEYVTNDVLKEILTRGMVSTNTYNFYVRYLFKNFILPSGLDDKFKIISPHTFATHGPDMKK
ncbi:uncharacterized protein LOC114727567 [Neltuma alba]|uniref:uncharacterized protein LOC114727567 n=1 Tax=Neltuma alba TaxID=207710 RepID=UPI0010A3C648|nr:uncharacterized protein LOC114727567 [Prosopis alba]